MQWAHNKPGFTIVELLIVVVVIAILATVTIVAYNGIQTRAKDSQMVSLVGTYVKAIQSYYSTNGTVPMSGSAVQCFDGTSCWSGTDVPASGVLRSNLSQIISTLPVIPSGQAALIVNATTTDSVQGGNYTGWYVLYQVYGTSCPPVGSLRFLNSNINSGILTCRGALAL